jgi:hypothetical protein
LSANFDLQNKHDFVQSGFHYRCPDRKGYKSGIRWFLQNNRLGNFRPNHSTQPEQTVELAALVENFKVNVDIPSKIIINEKQEPLLRERWCSIQSPFPWDLSIEIKDEKILVAQALCIGV